MDENKDINFDMNQNERDQSFDIQEDQKETSLQKVGGEISESEGKCESCYAFKWSATEADNEKKKKRKKPTGNPPWLPTLIIALTFIVAFVLFCSVLILDRRHGGVPTDTVSQSEETVATEAGKTVYIKEYDDASGILTPQQIYSACSPSVVTVLTESARSEGVGTGFIFDSGYIATAHHVIEGATSIKIITHDGKEYSAEVVKSDELSDLALLETDAHELPSLEFGSSGELLVGDELVAIGTPASIEFASSMTRGDVSYNGRTVCIYNEDDGTLRKKMTLIQTSAALNPGNSGGPVFDCYGKLVGIVTMRLGNSFDGISFVIPSDGAYRILCDMRDGIELTDDVISAVATRAARIGVLCESYIEDNTPQGKLAGVRISDFVSEEYDAAKKLRIGDVIVSIEGKPVKNAASLAEEISRFSPSDTVSVTVWRSEQLLTFGITLGS